MTENRDGSRIWADLSVCRHCGTCQSVCPNGVFAWRDDAIEVLHLGRCIRCGHCLSVCPERAFQHTYLESVRFEEAQPIGPAEKENLKAIIAQRRSCRQFTGEAVSEREMEDILEVARYAPSPTNSQNVRFVLFQTKDSIRELSMRVAKYYLDLERQLGDPQIRAETDAQVGKRTVDIYGFHLPAIIERFRAVQKGDDQLFYNAPMVIALYASGMAHLATASCSMTALEMLLVAETMGLAGCFNGYALTALTRDPTTANYAEIPPGYTPGAVLTLGHPAVHYRLVPPRRKPRIVRRK